ncbi:nose resistant to fluoxetine protein 6-like [Centruroides vittatus]|uniref:nose resistant to fluoxetine protein 6-like n=1 Tax=Centruroides vittatus TaxID=120091 RepID=UPI00351003EE
MTNILSPLFVLLFSLVVPGHLLPTNESLDYETQPADENEDALRFIKDMDGKMKTLIRSVVKSSLPYVLKMSEEVTLSSSCMSSLMRFVKDFMKMKDWTFSLLDSIGKPPSGFLRGTLWIQGDYDQCLDIETMENKVIRGKFCSVLIKFPKLRQETIRMVSSSDITIVQLLKNLCKPFSISQLLSMLKEFRLDVCIPDSCSENDLENIGNWIIRKPLKIEVEFCKTKEEKKEYSISQLICLAVFGTLIISVILATTVHALSKSQIVSKEQINGIIFDVVVSLSALSTTSKLFSGNIYENTRALSGIKVLLINYIIFGHVIATFGIIPTVFEKYINLSRIVNYIPTEIASNLYVLIESFFLISVIKALTALFSVFKRQSSFQTTREKVGNLKTVQVPRRNRFDSLNSPEVIFLLGSD